MELPIVTDTKPQVIDLEAGKVYVWCTCGLTEKGALCDGKHKGSGLKSLVFEVEESGTKYLCQCKKRKNAPYCDGSHNNL
jgi:CDGSH-type Zn-finger protein